VCGKKLGAQEEYHPRLRAVQTAGSRRRRLCPGLHPQGPIDGLPNNEKGGSQELPPEIVLG
jgi:hypothetical protein